MVTLPSLRYIRSLKNKWLACASLHSLQHLLKLTPRKLKWLQQDWKYTLFTIPKKDGSLRYIENPANRLKNLQRTVNDYLQAVYYFYKHPASYGFCIRVKNDKHPCTIYTHALQHTGCRWLLNADLKDFFHTVSWQMVYDLLGNPPFQFTAEARQWLANLCTHQGRLPMGAPTSPVVSNLAATTMDHALDALAKRNLCTYTRFADDLSFSSAGDYPATLKEEVLQVIKEHGFVPNLKKIKEYGPEDTKIVTGLQVAKTVSLGSAFWKKTEMLLEQLKALMCLLQTRPSITVHNQAEDLKEKLNGFLAFAQSLLGAEAEKAELVKQRMDNMTDELEEFESIGWDEIPYNF